MKVMMVHNFYRSSAPSGEDAVFVNERKLLEDNGVETVCYDKHNDDLDDSSFARRLAIGWRCGWSRSAYREALELLSRHRPDIAHVHSLHPQISPSVYAACQASGVPVVHTLHNYRYICPGALLFRDGRPCEECVGKLPYHAIRYRCYRGSLAATGSLFWMICYNRARGTFRRLVDRYIALTRFAASRLVAGGFPAELIEVKPNFLPVSAKPAKRRQRYAIFAGRLSAEKGVATLLNAWRSAPLPLKVAGDGPLRGALESQATRLGLDVQFLGTRPRQELLQLVAQAQFQVVPSEWYEGFPMVVLESFACATPVIASRIGSLAEVVSDGETGLHFAAGDAGDLARKVAFLSGSPEVAAAMGERGREVCDERYGPRENFHQLMGIYQRAIDDFSRRN